MTVKASRVAVRRAHRWTRPEECPPPSAPALLPSVRAAALPMAAWAAALAATWAGAGAAAGLQAVAKHLAVT